MSSIQLKKVVKSYGPIQVVHGIDLEIEEGEFVVLLGPSGCGKTTTLRMVAGLEDVSGGELSIGRRLMNEVAPKNRGVAMVFQNYALYPHMSVRQNMEFALRPMKLDAGEVSARINDTATILGLDAFLDRKPAQLSGGQRQRVAMGRAMVRSPEVFLFDEPLSNLDAKLRTQVRWEIAKLHKRLGTTVLYVTHDQIEAMTLADKIVVMKDGYVEQVGTPEEVFTRPRSKFVASFIGSPAMNLFPAEIENGRIETVSLNLPVPQRLKDVLSRGQSINVGIRPSEISIVEAGSGNATAATVEATEYLGAGVLLSIRIKSQEFVAEVPAAQRPVDGEEIFVRFNPEALHIFDAETDLVIEE